jgi:hypothetical protein
VPNFRSVFTINTKYVSPRNKTDVMATRMPSALCGERAAKVPVLGGDVEEPVRQTKERIQKTNMTTDLMGAGMFGKFLLFLNVIIPGKPDSGHSE